MRGVKAALKFLRIGVGCCFVIEPHADIAAANNPGRLRISRIKQYFNLHIESLPWMNFYMEFSP